MLYNKLNNYSTSNIYPFHMPGHKRNLFDKNIPYQIDITEINDFDNLHNATGCIEDIQKKASKLYSCNKTFLLINGATCGILASIRAMTKFGDTVIVARNCHKAVYNAIELCGLNPIYILPKTDKNFGICSSVTTEQIENAINENKNVSLVILTSPTYEGVVSDIYSISEICHKNGVSLFVDEAHGAHFPLSKNFPDEAVSCGADVAVVSLHKTLPSLTQTALLITKSEKFNDEIAEQLAIFETSSPSYIFMSAIEKCLEFCENSVNNNCIENYFENLKDFSEYCKSLKNLEVLCYGNDSLKNHNFYNFDISKIIVSFKNSNINSLKFAEMLRKNMIEPEMIYSDYSILMSSICDTKKGFEMLKKALTNIDNQIICKKGNRENFENYLILPQKSFSAFEKYRYNGEFVSFEKSIGKISLEYVWAYPPGIPLLVAGEIIDENIIEKINFLKNQSVNIYSTKEKMPNKIYTVT